jgi:hypothetical protein
MKQSKWRLILAITAIFPAWLCALLAIAAILEALSKRDLETVLYGFPFVSCIIIFVLFIIDTAKLYKENK